MSIISPERLAEVFVEFADTLVDEFDVIEFLQMVTTHTSDLIDARAVGLLLADGDGRLQVMAASDERAQMLELFQVQTHEGPCQDCYATGETIHSEDLREAGERWPRFASRAVEAGYRSVHAFPLRLRRHVIGALNLFSVEAGAMTPADVRVVQALADVATIGLLQERAIRRGEVLTEQLHTALNSRIVIEQAKGAIAQIHGGTPDEAFVRLRSYCRNHHVGLSETAARVLTDPASVAELTTPSADEHA
jgi:transcriptional regulator with GAF, ATPase, and Fis domain